MGKLGLFLISSAFYISMIYFGSSSLEKSIMLVKMNGKKRRRQPKAKWMDSAIVETRGPLEDLKD